MIETYLHEFLDFFFPATSAQLDWVHSALLVNKAWQGSGIFSNHPFQFTFGFLQHSEAAFHLLARCFIQYQYAVFKLHLLQSQFEQARICGLALAAFPLCLLSPRELTEEERARYLPDASPVSRKRRAIK